MAIISTVANAVKDDFIKYFKTDIFEEGAFTAAVDRYLRYNLTDAGMLIHWGKILGTGLLGQMTDNTVNRTRGGATDTEELKAMRLSVGSMPKEALDVLNTMYNTFKDPNIEGIPIKTPKIVCKREVQISEYGVIMESGYFNKYITDNASPSPRTWDISGYLTSCWDIDCGLVLKPSLQLQEKFLDAFAKSRRPLWFKTDECEFVTVQIASMEIDRQAENMNAHAITIQLKEFVPLETISKASMVRKAVFAFTH